jgi:hypothetical protein
MSKMPPNDLALIKRRRKKLVKQFGEEAVQKLEDGQYPPGIARTMLTSPRMVERIGGPQCLNQA